MKAYRQFVKALEKKDEETLCRLLKTSPEIQFYNGADGYLADLIRQEFPEFFPAAFACGLHPDAGDPKPNQTLLQRAASHGNIELVKLCLQHGAEVDRRNCEGETALGYAASWSSVEIVEILLKAGADVNAIEGKADEPEFFTTPLDAACSTNPEYNRPEIRDCLLKHGGKRIHELIKAPK